MSVSPDVTEAAMAMQSCGVCGWMLPRQANRCPACGSPVDATPLPVVTTQVLAAGTARSTALSSLLCYCVDAILIAICAAIGEAGAAAIAALVTSSSHWLAAGAILGFVIGVWATLHMYRRHGRGLGGLIAGVRIVDTVNLLPAIPFVPHGAEHARPVTLDVRRGRDPVTAALTPWTELKGQPRTETYDIEVTRPHYLRHGVPQGSVVLIFDSGLVHWFTGACMVGRSPVTVFGEDVLSLPDISRQLSPNHVEVRELADESGAMQLWVTDQGSAAGTFIEIGTQVEQLPAELGVRIQSGMAIRIGEHRFRVEWGES